MEIQDLQKYVVILVLVGVVLGVGILVMDKFSIAARSSETVVNESFNMTGIAETYTFAHGNMTEFTQILNKSNSALPSANYTINLTAGTLTAHDNVTGFKTDKILYAYYVYDDYNTEAAASLEASRDSLGDIASDWLPIIVIVAVCAVILYMVVSSFAGGRR